MKMHTKAYTASFKALDVEGDGEPGTFEAVVAVFDNVDRAGDRLKSQAFDKTLEAWRKSGDPIPVILSHLWDNPMAIIGHADPNDVRAVEGIGLVVKGQLHIGRGNEVADQVHYLMSQRLIKEFSFGYTVAPGGEKKASDGAYDLTEVNLIEFGPCLKGVNPATQLLAVKSALAERAPRTKAYVELELEGTYEETQDALRDALGASYPSGEGADWVGVSVVATTASEVVYQVCTNEGEAMYRAAYTVTDSGTIALGEPTEVALTVVDAAEKADEDIETPEAEETETKAEEDTELKSECPACGSLEETFGKACSECGETVAKAEEAPAPATEAELTEAYEEKAMREWVETRALGQSVSEMRLAALEAELGNAPDEGYLATLERQRELDSYLERPAEVKAEPSSQGAIDVYRRLIESAESELD